MSEACRTQKRKGKEIATPLKKQKVAFLPKLSRIETGMIKQHVNFWRSITCDANIIKMVKGCAIEFNKIPHQTVLPLPYKFVKERRFAIDKEVQKMFCKGVIRGN